MTPSRSAQRADAARNRARVLEAASAAAGRRPRPAPHDGADRPQRPASARARSTAATPTARRSPWRSWTSTSATCRPGSSRGPPPLGPGAPPAARLAAFYEAFVAHLEAHGHLARAVEGGAPSGATARVPTPRGRRRRPTCSSARRGWETDANALAEQLLAPARPRALRLPAPRSGRSPRGRSPTRWRSSRAVRSSGPDRVVQRGRVKRKALPPPSAASAQMRPP